MCSTICQAEWAKPAGTTPLVLKTLVPSSSATLTFKKAVIEARPIILEPVMKVEIDVKYVGRDIPNEFVVGYGLDYKEKYRNLRDIGTLAPHVYS